MKKYILHISILLLLTAACSVTRKVPDDAYLLNRVTINSDARTVGSSQLRPFLRQQPNSTSFPLGRARLRMYNIPNNDYTWLNRQLLQRGEPPVLFSEPLTAISAEQIRLHLNNRGYLNAVVDTVIARGDRRVNVTYNVTANEPHRILHFVDTIHSVDSTIYNILRDSRRIDIIREGDIFDRQVLEEGRIRLTNRLRNRGFYNLRRDDFVFYADTTVGVNQVNLILSLHNPPGGGTHQQYRIGNVTVVSGVDNALLQDSTQHHLLDTVMFRDIQIISEKNRFLRPRAIYHNTFLRPGRLYSDRVWERTITSLNALGPVSRAEILQPTPVIRNDTNYLDMRIILQPGNFHFLQYGIDGTNSAGDLGVSSSIIYEHRNFFRGGERFRVSINAAYEFISSSDSISFIDHSFFEYGVDLSLSVPQLMFPWLVQRLQDRPAASTDFSLGVNFQRRPEYLRQFFHFSNRFRWHAFDWRMENIIEPIGITYIRMPWTSELFDELFVANPMLQYSYSEQSIVRTSYSFTYTNVSRIPTIATPRMPIRISAGIEIAGWLPRVVTALGGSRTDSDGFQNIFGVRYAQYVRTDFSFATLYDFDRRNTVATRLALGVAVPYGNSRILPFERRYFAGGANSVRGWSTRTLGPGTYHRDDLGNDFVNRVGDIRFDFSVEYRHRLSNLFELATFIDAGNIWTIRDYAEQPGGVFRWNEFYREIAVAYGAGMRLNFGFLVFRLDLGMKAHNPALPQGERWSVFTPDIRRDLAFHFAIGHPF